MDELEAKTLDAKQEMAVADALDEIRTRNARNERAGTDREVTVSIAEKDSEQKRQEQEDEHAARMAFMKRHDALEEVIEDEDGDMELITKEKAVEMPPPTFKRVVKKKKDHAALLGIKKKPSLV